MKTDEDKAAMARNNLAGETSPYLLQHRENPVHWQPWGEAAMAAARTSNKPVLLSIGYAACHWCHVMAHESFEDPAIADIMNNGFINIKVDREERPDVDAIYQKALGLMGRQGGWPLTMFLTPQGEPFFGGTYFPDTPRYGHPGFADVLRRIGEMYQQDPDKVREQSAAMVEALRKAGAPNTEDGAVALEPQILDQIAHHLLGMMDQQNGGLTGAPKFPHVPTLELLWRRHMRAADEKTRDAVVFALNRMCQGGIYDHLGGGFARYATDDAWLVPHFEKMLYDNAQLLDMMILVWCETGDPLLRQRIYETVEWLLRDMRGAGGAFASSLDADSEGVEGKFYVWDEAEIDQLLGADSASFKATYDVRPGGNWEGHNILNRSHDNGLPEENLAGKLADCRQILFRTRFERIPPGWDDKILTDWNGLMIAALARAAAVFGEADWSDAAKTAFAFITDTMQDHGRLWHSHRAGKSQHAGLLEDYGFMCRAALRLYETTGEDGYLQHCRAWVTVLNEHFWDPENGGYFTTPNDGEALISRERLAHDGAIPSGNGIMAEVLGRLWLITGEVPYREQAEKVFAAFTPELRRNFFPLTTLLNSADLFMRASQTIIIGALDDPASVALFQAAAANGDPAAIIIRLTDGDTLPDGHPAAGKSMIEGRPAAYVCHGATCSLPITDVAALQAALRQPGNQSQLSE